jgi:hypothetical protein
MSNLLKAEYRYLLDWNRDGNFDHPYSDISEYVLTSSWGYGSNSPEPGQTKAGSATLKVDNSSSIFSYYNEDSPLFGLVLPGVRLKIYMKVTGGTWHQMYVCELNDIIPEVGLPQTISTAEITATGILGRGMDAGTVDIPVQDDIYPGQAIALICDEVGVPSDDRSIANGIGRIGRWWAREGRWLDLMRELEIHECGLLREGKTVPLVFEGRNTRVGKTVRSSYGTGVLRPYNLKQASPLAGICNRVEANVRTFNDALDATLVILTDSENGLGGGPIYIANGETKVLNIEFPNDTTPNNYLAVRTWGIVDIFVYTGLGPTDEDITDQMVLTREEFGQKLVVTVQNNSGENGYIRVLRAHGSAIVEGDPIPVKSNDGPVTDKTTSQGKFGIRSFPNPSQWLTSLVEAQTWADFIVARDKDPRPSYTYELRAGWDDDQLQEAQAIDVSDLIYLEALDDFGLFVAGNFFVEFVQHNVDEVKDHTVQVYCRKTPPVTLGATGTSIDSKTIGDVGPPDLLYANAMDPGGRVVIGVMAGKHNADIFKGEIRAKYYATETPASVDLRTADEGGTFAHNGTTNLILTDLSAGPGGVNYQFTSPGSGRWYYAARLCNTSCGWSVWSDGNTHPQNVTQYVTTESGLSADSGPPADSTVSASIVGGMIVPKATRPAQNGTTILDAVAQVKDGSQGDFHNLDANTGPAVTYYDGGGADHVYNKSAGTITCPIAADLSAVLEGHLILFDVDNASGWDRDNCQWGTVPANAIKGNVISGVPNFRPNGDPDTGQTWEHIRIKIIKPPWDWTGDGYLGDTPGRGISSLEFWSAGKQGDRTTQTFEFPAIGLPGGLAMGDLRVRVWFGNKICRALCGTSTGGAVLVDTGNPSGANGLEIITHTIDPSVPAGFCKFRWYRDTTNFHNVFAVGFWLSRSLPAEGPFSAERTAHPAIVLEEGTCTITAGDVTVSLTRAINTAVLSQVFLIFTNDASPDDDLDGNAIVAEGLNYIGLYSPFQKSGTFNYAIIKPYYDPADGYTTNLAYYQFRVPDEVGGDIEATQYESPLIPMPSGHWYVSGCSRNPFGVGTEMTADSEVGGANAFCVVLADAPTVIINASQGGQYNEKLFVWSVDGNRTLGAPINALCGRKISLRISNTSASEAIITLDEKFMNGQICPMEGPFNLVETTEATT